MLPTIDLWGVHVPTYPLMVVLGMLGGCAVAYERGRRDGHSLRSMLVPAIVACAGGVLGARLWSGLFELAPMTGEWSWGGMIWSGGLSVMGGLAVGGLGAWGATGYQQTGFIAWADSAVSGAAVGIAIGRMGCLLTGCCYGSPTLGPLAIVFDNFDTTARPIGVPLHPTQLYASLAALALAVIVWRVPHEPRGLRLASFAVGYGGSRALVELLRADYRGRLLGVPTTMLGALLVFAVGVTAVAWLTGQRRRSGAGSPG